MQKITSTKKFSYEQVQKVIDCYDDGSYDNSFRNNYCVWKFGKPKHNYYVQSRKTDFVTLDDYDGYILDNLSPGKTITYDAAGYYLDRAVEDLEVIEVDDIVLKWYPRAIIELGEQTVEHLYHQADNFIVINTIRLRWKTFDDYTDYWIQQTRFLKPGSQVFFSFRDIFIFHNRLKYHFSDLLNQWLVEMQSYGFLLVNLQHDLIKIDSNMTDITKMIEIDDMVNGNIKIHWTYKP